jgi:hypothetical protein
VISSPDTRRFPAAPRPLQVGIPWLTADTAGLSVLVLITGFTCWRLLANGTTIGQDAATQFYPWYSYLGDRLRDLEIPSWNPAQFSGAPFVADPQSGWSYLPAMVLFTFFSIDHAVPAFIAFHLALAGFGAYGLARSLQIPPIGALTAATAYELSGPIFSRSVCCPAQVQVGAWVPLLLLGAEMAAQRRTFREQIPWIALSSVAMSQILASWLGQGSYYALMLIGAYIVYRCLIDPPGGREPLTSRIVKAGIIGSTFGLFAFGLAAIGIVPRLEYNRLSNLAGGTYVGADSDAAVTGGWHAGKTIIEHIAREPYYPGGIAVALATTAWLLTRGRNATPFFSLTVIVGFILSSDRRTPLHSLLYAILPRFEELHQHWPERITLTMFIALAILAGTAVGALPGWFGRGRDLVRIALVPAVITIAIMIALAQADDALPLIMLISVSLCVLIFVVGSVRSTASIWPFLPGLLVFLLTIDFLLANRSMLAHGPYGGYHKVDLVSYYEERPGAEFVEALARNEPSRYFGFDTWLRHTESRRPALYRFQFPSERTQELAVNNRATVYGMNDVQGYNPVQMQAYVDFMTGINEESQEYHDANVYPAGLDSPLLDLLNARYIIIPSDIPEGRTDLLEAVALFPTIYEDTAVRVLERTTAFPRAWIVHEARQVDAAEAREQVSSGTVDPYTTALLDRPVDLQPLSGTHEADRATIHELEPEKIVVETSTDAPGVLLLSEVAYPAWEAYVDGQSVDIATAFGLLRAIPIPSGDHVLTLRFESDNEIWGLILTTATAALVLAGLGWSKRAKLRVGPFPK